MSYRGVFFCIVLVLLWVPCLAILAQFSDVGELGDIAAGKWFAIAIANSAPLIAQDASLFGELTPVAVAAALTLLAPGKTETKLIYFAVLLCIVGWGLYLTLSVALQDGSEFHNALQTSIEGDVAGSSGFPAIHGFVSATRVFYLVVGASLVGINLRGART
jgi:hypothetical protein